MSTKLVQPFLTDAALLTSASAPSGFAYCFFVDGDAQPVVRVTSCFTEMGRVPSTILELYNMFPLFLEKLALHQFASNTRCRVEQLLYWDPDSVCANHVSLSSAVGGTFAQLVLDAVKSRPAYT